MVEYLEKNFARTISPLEYEKLNTWLEDFSEDMVKYAIDLSILNNKKTFSYIAGILKNWKANGYKTLADVKEERKESSNWIDVFN
jgi:DnaD/phage-associated family protein